MVYKTTEKQRANALARYYAKREEILKKQIAYKNKMYHENPEFREKRDLRDSGRQGNKKVIYSLKDKVCEICGCKENLQRHHKKYTTELKDIQILCRNCHIKTHKQTLMEEVAIKQNNNCSA